MYLPNAPERTQVRLFCRFFANKSDTLTHGKSSQYSADAEAGYMAEKKKVMQAVMIRQVTS